MANEVVIDITVNDEVGPGLDSAMAKIAAFRKAVRDMSQGMDGAFTLKMNLDGIDSQLAQLKSKLQSHGIADLIDFNLNAGQIDSQLVLLKKKIEQHKIPDLLAINATGVEGLNLKANVIGLPDSFTRPLYLIAKVIGAPSEVGGSVAAAAAAGGAAAGAAAGSGGDGGDGGPRIRVGGWGWGRMAFNAASNLGKIPLFGTPPKFLGWLPGILATVGGVHLLADAFIETLGVVIPATVALGAFGVAAADTVSEMYTRENELVTVQHALGASTKEFGTQAYAATGHLRGLKGGLTAIQDAVKPDVFMLLGMGLEVASQHGQAFAKMAEGAGGVVAQLGARAALALGGNGLTGWLMHGVSDLNVLGNTGGNVLGIIGNLLRPLPGYAEMLARGLELATGAIESVTGSSIFQLMERVILGFHGMWIYGGLAALGVGKVLSSGIGSIGKVALSAAIGLEKVGGQGNAAAMGMEKFAYGADKAAGLPWGWIAAAAVALGVLTYSLLTAKDAVQQWGADMQNVLNKQPAIRGYILNVKDQAIAIDQLGKAQAELLKAKSAPPVMITVEGQGIEKVNSQIGVTQQRVIDYQGVLQNLRSENTQYSQNMTVLSKTFGGAANAQALLTSSGITYGQVATANKRQLAMLIMELTGYNLALQQLAGYGGRYAAATNAMAYADGDLYKAAKQVASAQDAVMGTVTGSEQAFYQFITTLKQTGIHAYSASAGFKVLSGEAKKMSDFWNSLIPQSQQLIDSLNAQQISTTNLTTAVADIAKQDLIYAGHNTAARAAIVALINNALGPGTVSLKSMNTWVKHNSGSLRGFNRIIAESTIKAGTLAGVIQKQLITQFAADILVTSGVNSAMKDFASAITHGGTKTEQFHNARQRLIRDLENAGFSAQGATQYVDGLQQKIDALHGKSVSVNVVGHAGGTLTFATQAFGQNSKGYLQFHAAGGLVGGSGTGTSDSNPAMLSRGEFVVNASSTARHLPLLKAINARRMAAGGLVGMTDSMSTLSDSWARRAEAGWANIAVNAMKHMLSTFAVGSGSGGSHAAMAFARSHLAGYGWGASQWPPLYALWMRESGWSPWAVNKSSGAYGIPQSLGHGHPYNLGDYVAQVLWGLSYISGRYGSPASAWAHELAFGWYDHGGALPPGLSLAYNGTGRPERVMGPGSDRVVLEIHTSGAQGTFDQFLLKWIQRNVRVRGGGDVQVAFGGAS